MPIFNDRFQASSELPQTRAARISLSVFSQSAILPWVRASSALQEYSANIETRLDAFEAIEQNPTRVFGESDHCQPPI
jgi:hypothetical protein